MAELLISKKIGTDQESGCQMRVDITGVYINIQSKTIDINYDVNLIGKTGQIVAPKEVGRTYTRRNTPAKIGIRQVEGEAPGVTEEYEESPADNKFDQLAESEVGLLIKAMLESDLKNYPNL